MKGTVIFADQNLEEEKQEAPLSQPQNPPKVMLSRDEYREVVKEAYKEGVKDALKEQHTDKPAPKDAESQEEGQKAATKSQAKNKEETKQKLETITSRHEIEILRAKTVFPFTIFPDTIIIDTTKVTIIKKLLFATEFVSTIPLKDLSDVNMQTVLFLGSLDLKYMPQSHSSGLIKPIEVRIANLRREDAIKAKNFLKGALVANAEGIDIAKLTPEEVVNVIKKFGNSQGVA